MDTVGQLDRELLRARIALAAFLAAFMLLGFALWRIQVLHTSAYRSRLDRQSMRRVRLPGARGAMFDGMGVCLANNRPSYGMAVYLEEMRSPGRISNTLNEAETVISSLARTLNLERSVTREDIWVHMQRRCPLPLVAWQDLDERALARWAESTCTYPGVDICVEPVRMYPQGTTAAHVIGYVGRLDPDFGEFYHFYLPEMEGKAGLERALNDTLAGVAGGSLLRVDAMGFKHDELGERAPIAGEDVVLTLDLRIQRFVEEALAGRRAAAVVLDPRNGDILALASSPTFDPKSIRSVTEMNRLTNDADKPLLNRAVSGQYPPGSIFKPVVALAALESGRATAGTIFDCAGKFEIGNAKFGCWNKLGHGRLGMREAIEQSCNCYFCQLGLVVGVEAIHDMAEALGLGRPSGVELGGEARGLLPDPAWKMRTSREGWWKGDTCNLSIGQGALLVTPLQMAVMAGALGNEGHVYVPRLVRNRTRRSTARYVYQPPDAPPDTPLRNPAGEPDAPGRLVRRINVSAQSLATVRSGMYDVVQGEHGTGRRAGVPGVAIGGKTGSAEYGPRGERKKHTWMIAFAPFDSPRYAIALVVEDGVSGGVTAAPRVGYVLAKIFGVQTGTTALNESASGFDVTD